MMEIPSWKSGREGRFYGNPVRFQGNRGLVKYDFIPDFINPTMHHLLILDENDFVE